MEPRFKWQDALGLVGVLLAIGGMADMPLGLRVVCFGLCAVSMPISFLNQNAWPILLRWLLALSVVALMSCMVYYAIRASTPKNKSVTLQWNDPQAIHAATPLSKTQLNATALSNGKEVDGEFVYNPTFGATLPTGVQTLSATFTPKDLEYTLGVKTVKIQVLPQPIKEPVPALPKDPIIINSIHTSDNLIVGSPISIRINMQNVSGKTIRVKDTSSTSIGRIFASSVDNIPVEEALWRGLINASSKSPASDVTTADKGLFNVVLQSRHLTEADVNGFREGNLVAFFSLVYQDAKRNTDIVEVCGYVVGPDTFRFCSNHNKP